MSAPPGRPSWLPRLAAHPVFRGDGASEAHGAHKHQLLAVRGTELIVVVHNEVRLTSLAQAKRTLSRAADDAGADADAAALTYKVLTHECLSFPIVGIAVNPTGKLLAVYGTHEVVMLLLPRRGFLQHVGTACPVKAMRVGAYYHAPHGCAAVAQCTWHPLGRDGASLVVLTEDALLREYDVVHDLDEPQQTIACAPGAGRSHAALSADDEDATCAVAMALADATAPGDEACAPQSAWLACTVLVLMRSGDVYAVCPFLPKVAALPRAVLTALSRAPASSDLARRYVGDLVRQARATTPAHAHDDVSLDGDATVDAAAHVVVRAPAAVPHRVAPQGPFLLRPAPPERSDEVAPVASDLFCTRIGAPPGVRAAPLDVVGIAMGDGHVHLCLLAAPLAPAWHTARGAGAPPSAPTLAVYETVALPVVRDDAAIGAAQDRTALQFVRDPLYPDTVFVTHRGGAHRIVVAWAAPLLEAIATDAAHVASAVRDGPRSTLTCLATTPNTPDDAPRVVGAALVHDVYLSYTFLAITSDTQLVATELPLRTPPTLDAASDDVPMDVAYTTLLDGGAFAAPAFPAAPAPGARGAPLDVSAASLRALGTAAEQVRARMREVVVHANRTQARAEQQVQETQRQVAQLGEVAARLAALDADALRARLARIEAGQRTALARADALLQQLMDEHQPQLSVYEQRWLDELRRMAREFGVGDAPRAPAVEQLHKLQHQLAVLRPALPQYAAHQRDATPRGQRLGTVQTQRVESLLAHEAHLLAQARAKVQWMQHTLAPR